MLSVSKIRKVSLLGVLISILLPMENSYGMGSFSTYHECQPDPTPTPTPRPRVTPTRAPISAVGPERGPLALISSGPTVSRLESIAECRSFETTGGKQRALRSNWRLDNFLWKPVAEHYNGLVVVTLPRGAYNSVTTWSLDKRKKGKIKLSFRSRGDAGDAWADFTRSGMDFAERNGPTVVELRGKGTRTRRFLIQCPAMRSDGQVKNKKET